jgi:parvulin-like peptidyl-prolyl isomerase
MRRSWIFIFGVLLVLAVVYSEGTFGAEDEILAKVGNEVITRIDFETRLKSFPPTTREELKKFEKKKLILDNMIKARLFVVEGENRKLNEKPDIKAGLRMIRDDYITQEFVRAYIENKVEVSEEEVQNYYNTNPEIKERELLKISQIVMEKEEEAKEILERLKKGEHFKKLAKERSIDPVSKPMAGELDWFEKGEGEKEIEDAVANLEKGGISGIIKAKGVYYILKLDEKRVIPKPPYLKIKDDLTQKFGYKKLTEVVNKEIEDLKKKITIETFYEKLSSENK